MDQLAAQPYAIARHQIGVRQIHGQCRVVLLYIRAEQEERGTIQSQLELRQKPRIMKIDSVGIAIPSDDVAAVIE